MGSEPDLSAGGVVHAARSAESPMRVTPRMMKMGSPTDEKSQLILHLLERFIPGQDLWNLLL